MIIPLYMMYHLNQIKDTHHKANFPLVEAQFVPPPIQNQGGTGFYIIPRQDINQEPEQIHPMKKEPDPFVEPEATFENKTESFTTKDSGYCKNGDFTTDCKK